MNKKLVILYKTYVLILLPVSVLAIVAAYLTPEQIAWKEYFVRTSIFILSLIGLGGLAWRKPIGKQAFWKVFFWLFVGLTVYAVLFSDMMSRGIGGITVALPLLAFHLYGLWRYTYRSKDIWR